MKTLKQVLEERGTNVTEFAKKAGMPRTSIYNITNGRGSMEKVTVANFMKMAHALGMTADELIEELGLFVGSDSEEGDRR